MARHSFELLKIVWLGLQALVVFGLLILIAAPLALAIFDVVFGSYFYPLLPFLKYIVLLLAFGLYFSKRRERGEETLACVMVAGLLFFLDSYSTGDVGGVCYPCQPQGVCEERGSELTACVSYGGGSLYGVPYRIASSEYRFRRQLGVALSFGNEKGELAVLRRRLLEHGWESTPLKETTYYMEKVGVGHCAKSPAECYDAYYYFNPDSGKNNIGFRERDGAFKDEVRSLSVYRGDIFSNKEIGRELKIFSRSSKADMNYANGSKAPFVVVIGDVADKDWRWISYTTAVVREVDNGRGGEEFADFSGEAGEHAVATSGDNRGASRALDDPVCVKSIDELDAIQARLNERPEDGGLLLEFSAQLERVRAERCRVVR